MPYVPHLMQRNINISALVPAFLHDVGIFSKMVFSVPSITRPSAIACRDVEVSLLKLTTSA